jgi:hypothetical protein
MKTKVISPYPFTLVGSGYDAEPVPKVMPVVMRCLHESPCWQ